MTNEYETQQDALKDVIRNHIAPTMKEHGFKKKARWFHQEGTKYTRSMNVYSSQWNTRDDVRFKLEVRVKEGDEVKEWGGVIDPETRKELWYRLTPSVEPNAVGKQVTADIDRVVLPYMKKFE